MKPFLFFEKGKLVELSWHPSLASAKAYRNRFRQNAHVKESRYHVSERQAGYGAGNQKQSGKPAEDNPVPRDPVV